MLFEMEISTFVLVKECKQLFESIISEFELKRKTKFGKILKVGSSKIYNGLQINLIKIRTKKNHN
jgi:hypothetical protein